MMRTHYESKGESVKDPANGHVTDQNVYAAARPTASETGSLCLAYVWPAMRGGRGSFPVRLARSARAPSNSDGDFPC